MIHSARLGGSQATRCKKMIREWYSSQYLGHASLKAGFDVFRMAVENVALTLPTLVQQPDSTTGTAGLGGYLRVSTTFMYKINGATYMKGLGITSAVNTGDSTCSLIPHSATNNTATGGYDVTATRYRAGVLLIDSAGLFTSIVSSVEGGSTWGVSAANRANALGYLVNRLTATNIADKAIVAFFAVGDGTNAFTSTSTLTINTNFDVYGLGGMALATGQSTDGGQMLGLL